MTTKWFHIGKGYLCFSILMPPNFSIFTLELRSDGKERDFALAILNLAIVYQWDVK